ncbi:MAG TPA: iron-sulfur cluster biosynthesis family protein [Gaiellales bacterium]|nr:iron-sulfur cluster biosynthesis family protein [Gaiellales bacterium]
MMITLTTEATDAIRELVDNAELPDTGGLRLDMNDATMNSAPPSLALTLVETPATGDEVIDQDDVHVYVSRQAAPLLDGKEIDARNEPGGVTFLVNENA